MVELERKIKLSLNRTKTLFSVYGSDVTPRRLMPRQAPTTRQWKSARIITPPVGKQRNSELNLPRKPSTVAVHFTESPHQGAATVQASLYKSRRRAHSCTHQSKSQQEAALMRTQYSRIPTLFFHHRRHGPQLRPKKVTRQTN